MCLRFPEPLLCDRVSLMRSFSFSSLDYKKHILTRTKKFELMSLGSKSTAEVKDIDISNYAKFILQEGGMDKKR